VSTTIRTYLSCFDHTSKQAFDLTDSLLYGKMLNIVQSPIIAKLQQLVFGKFKKLKDSRLKALCIAWDYSQPAPRLFNDS
jgi:hypothetical protein